MHHRKLATYALTAMAGASMLALTASQPQAQNTQYKTDGQQGAADQRR